MQFQGDHIFPMLPEALFKLLSDARFLVSCLPDATNVKLVSADEAYCTVRPNFTFSTGTLDVTLRVSDRQPPTAERARSFHLTASSPSPKSAAAIFSLRISSVPS